MHGQATSLWLKTGVPSERPEPRGFNRHPSVPIYLLWWIALSLLSLCAAHARALCERAASICASVVPMDLQCPTRIQQTRPLLSPQSDVKAAASPQKERDHSDGGVNQKSSVRK
mmetsp:Transcript_80679/g.241616  ORF Transcript_80679/g.241616 Transcript_80679/m.241616 type:complete len:114 (-) Transcript_80679:129-470(-)